MIGWFLHFIGVEPRQTSTAYNFWSGFGSDLMYFAVIGGFFHSMNCHEYGCWRPGMRVTVEPSGHHYRRCRKHHQERHPDGSVS